MIMEKVSRDEFSCINSLLMTFRALIIIYNTQRKREEIMRKRVKERNKKRQEKQMSTLKAFASAGS